MRLSNICESKQYKASCNAEKSSPSLPTNSEYAKKRGIRCSASFKNTGCCAREAKDEWSSSKSDAGGRF